MKISCAWNYLLEQSDDALFVCAAEDVRILELRINESLWRLKRWIHSRGLTMARQEIFLIPEDRSRRTLGRKENKHQVPGGAVGSKA